MSDAPIIVKKKKHARHKRHGGAWKVAYADFVTAMMAFFLLLWLLNAATKEQLEGISNYFAPVSTRPQSSGSGGFLAGEAAAEKGTLEARDEKAKPTAPATDAHGFPAPEAEAPTLDEREERQLADAEKALRAAVAKLPNAEVLSKSLLVDNTPEGLRIQIVEQEGLPMFPRGGSTMYTHTEALLSMVAKVILEMPQAVSISGHTDALPFRGSSGYSNWELSADRANAVRRALVGGGVPESRIARVIGKAANELLLPDQPEAPGNRRMTVVLLRGSKAPR
jgi:chemotaxis protein MotB